MRFISELRERVEALAALGDLDVEPSELAARADALANDVLLTALGEAAAIVNGVERLRVVLAGVTARRSSRVRGHSGLAATEGHRTPADLVQSVTGVTLAEARRQVRQGESMLEGLRDNSDRAGQGEDRGEPDNTSAGEGRGDAGAGEDRGEAGAGEDQDPPEARPTLWHEPLRRALMDGTLTAAQHDAIFRGLGEPPTRPLPEEESAAVFQAWTLAAEQLRDEAGGYVPEELRRRARQVRDALDPVGAEERFTRRYEQRSFRMWVDDEGQHHARIIFDDEMAAWVRAMVDAALRPRRGGPRFVDAEQKKTADELAADPRTNEQLTYDLIIDTLRTGSLAATESVFGARQPGVRMVVIKDTTGPRDALGRMIATGHLEDGGDAIPGSVIDRTLCTTGSRDITVDRYGNPLDVGREQRLFTTRQRLALAIRDGGCIWPECSIPASYCEAHHCDHWHEHNGHTNCDRGVLLCRFHHMLLHNNRWRITRDGTGPFILQPPPGKGDPITLVSKSAVRWAWDPPPRRNPWRTQPRTSRPRTAMERVGEERTARDTFSEARTSPARSDRREPAGPPPEGAPPEGAPPEGAPSEGAPSDGAPPEAARIDAARIDAAPPHSAPPDRAHEIRAHSSERRRPRKISEATTGGRLTGALGTDRLVSTTALRR